MTTVVRIKRGLEDSPLNALLVSCKRRKIVENESEEENITNVPNILTFAGTINNQEDDVNEHIAKHRRKSSMKNSFKQHITNIIENTKNLNKKRSAENRYKVVNTSRCLNTSIDESEKNIVTTLVDVEDSKFFDSLNLDDENIKFAYDIYYGVQDTADDTHDIECIDIPDQEEFWELTKNLNNGFACEESDGESTDSNAEDNERNDYPESEHSQNSIDEDDMRKAVKNLHICDDDDSNDNNENDSPDNSSIDYYPDDYSSDYAEEIADREYEFVSALNENDVENFGFAYARYKQKLKENEDSSDSE